VLSYCPVNFDFTILVGKKKAGNHMTCIRERERKSQGRNEKMPCKMKNGNRVMQLNGR
jgi:hypothetical protein